MTMTVTSIYMKDKRCQMEAAYNMVLGDKKINQLKYNVCMARQDNERQQGKIPYNRPKYSMIPSD